MRDDISLIVQHDLNFPVMVDVEPDREGIHMEVPLRLTKPDIPKKKIPPTSNAPRATPADPTPLSDGPSTTTLCPASVAPRGVIEAPGVLIKILRGNGGDTDEEALDVKDPDIISEEAAQIQEVVIGRLSAGKVPTRFPIVH
ncbi:hypothetical protein HAX54_050213 [Datura stramonium]|uniref:Uncharacterized protein n=1 Tax=Datura stramonium TaxID=4076 RepID=A0ABS8SXS8_DATST|nr:hypothetical protein [Datura stramonium]